VSTAEHTHDDIHGDVHGDVSVDELRLSAELAGAGATAASADIAA
jgi:ring-1,2-phenylacetyl-CoA epoxidase subunit PaaC